MPSLNYLHGMKFGQWSVMGRHHTNSSNGKPMWVCRCTCGITKPVRASDLAMGKSTGCGCARNQRTRDRSTIHGHSSGYPTTNGWSPEYTCWMNMIARCTNPNRPDWKYYGGRGITVCEEWQQNFQCFLDDIGYKPFPKATVDRINNNGHYTPSNCRWATRKQQAQNRRGARSAITS